MSALRRLTGDGDLLAAEARLIANHGTSTTPALQAVTHRDVRRFAPHSCRRRVGSLGLGSVVIDMGEV